MWALITVKVWDNFLLRTSYKFQKHKTARCENCPHATEMKVNGVSWSLYR